VTREPVASVCVRTAGARRPATGVLAALAVVLVAAGCTPPLTWTDTVPEPFGFVYSADNVQDVSCAAEVCVVVGQVAASVWDGSRWADTRLPANTWAGFVSCGAPTFCLASMSATSDGGRAPLVRLDGLRWVPADDPTGALAGATATDLACTGATFCMAGVSRDATAGLVRWDGTTWARTPAPSLERGHGPRVACAGPDACLAIDNVGDDGTTVAAAWDGRVWSPIGGAPAFADDVTCGAPDLCLVSGSDRAAGQPTLTRWDGRSWTAMTGVGPAGAHVESFSCASASVCGAIVDTGGDEGATPYLTDAAGAWRPEPLPAGSFSNPTRRISCTAAGACLVVGTRREGDATHRVARWWNGTAWAAEPDLTRPTKPAGSLQGVACPTDDWCVGVGTGQTGGSRSEPVAQHWTGGRWSIVPLPPVAYAGPVDVSCASPSFCAAVGFSATGQLRFDRILQWNGVAWGAVDVSPVLGPSPGPIRVSCPTASFCIAAGYGVPLSYDGSSWARLAPPPVRVDDVDCLGSTWCRAVGYAGEDMSAPVIHAWDGRSWSATPTPSYAGSPAWGQRIACATARRCVVAARATGVTAAHVLTFDGAAWRAATVMPGRQHLAMAAACADADRCVLATAGFPSEDATVQVSDTPDIGVSWRPTGPPPHGAGLQVQPLDVACRPSWCLVVGSLRDPYDDGYRPYAARLALSPGR
jgi:hypothetical protein